MSEAEKKFPTEVIDLPSRGWFYSENHPLSSGQLELYYMTAYHEDILTSRNLIRKGIVIDKLLESLIVDKRIKMDDMLLGDISAVMIAARILGYGKEYSVHLECPSCEGRFEKIIDLQEIEDKQSPLFIPENKGRNAFNFQLPMSKKIVTFKFLTNGDEKSIRSELEGLRKALRSDVSKESTTRLRYSLLSVEGDDGGDSIRSFVETMPARDALALRDYIRSVGPDIDLTQEFECATCGYEGRVEIPMDANFFWPNARIQDRNP